MEMKSPRIGLPIACALALWAVLIVTAFGVLALYGQKPGESTVGPDEWPTDTPLRPDHAGMTLVMFIHPHCPCTNASVAELERVLTESGAEIAPRFVLFRPADESAAWARSSLRTRVERIEPGEVHDDPMGEIARRFGATTSGGVMVFGADGALLFRGGITPSRGHEGASVGRTNLLRLLTGGAARERETPVYGCSLFACGDEGA